MVGRNIMRPFIDVLILLDANGRESVKVNEALGKLGCCAMCTIYGTLL